MRAQRKGADLQSTKQDNIRLDGTIPQSLATNILAPRLIPFPSFKTSHFEEMKQDLNQNSDISENGQLLNENLEFTLEISYLKARLKRSETARAVAERKIDNLEEKLKQAEKLLVQPLAAQDTLSEQTNSKLSRAACPSYVDSSVQQIFPGKADHSDMMSYNVMMCLDRILKAVLLLDEKITCYQKS
ncbi:uncharacterized protein LOC114575371 isoform X1 [Exaiptasia diaphana]|uniref:Uncharacterized protein n=1 Tax=Exaiptasia diaphana TaxID=2652724 RepID=A0A913YKE8_EXADI|nr:uncharacterized protein LOC114575371 isoform X1 [Exaiptasia diaphana]